MSEIDPLFAFHKLNAAGVEKSKAIAVAFSELLEKLRTSSALEGREGALVKTNLEQASFFAKKSMACQTEHQEDA